MTETIRVLFFSFAADRMKNRVKDYRVDAGTTLRAFFDREIASTAEAHFDDWMYSVNADWAEGDTILHDGDEVAVIPPVSGG